jgi:undecaprenyl-diphosphatase
LLEHAGSFFLLGLVQGVSEFLPISSDGHLVILDRWLETPGDNLMVIVLLHLGSLAALLLAFRADLLAILRSILRPRAAGEGGRRLLLLLILATIPAVIVGPLFERWFSSAFGSPRLAAAMLIVTGMLLIATRFLPVGSARPGPLAALTMGVAQVFALLPGISRSATTLSAGFALGLDRVAAARFSFLMAIPAIAGAAVFELRHWERLAGIDRAGVAIGIVTAFLSGLVAIRLLLHLVRRGRFEWFGVYCIALGALVLFAG